MKFRTNIVILYTTMLVDYLIMPVYGIIAGLLASIPLGPIGVLCIQRTLSGSHRGGFVSGLGAATADTIFAGLAVFALSWITVFVSRYEIWVEVASGLLIMIFGLTIFLKKPKRSSPTHNNGKGGGDVSNFLSVLFITLPNPAYFFVFVTIFAAMGVGGVDCDLTQKWLIISGVIVGAGSWWLFLTWIVNKFRRRFTMRSLLWLNRISGGLIFVLGAYAIIAVIYKLVRMLIDTGALTI